MSSVCLHVLQLGYGVMPEFERAGYADVPAYFDFKSATENNARQYNARLAFLVWMRLWLHWLCGVGQDEVFVEPTPYTPNRRMRRTQNCSISFTRYYHHYLLLGPRDITPTQFLERVCRLSPLGRIRIYRMRQFGSVLRRRAMLICYDHGWWRAPIGAFGRLYAGLWHVHLLPDWRNQANP